MKSISTLVLLLIAFVGFSQVNVPAESGSVAAQVYLTFEDGVIIPEGTTGVSMVDGTKAVEVKVGDEFVPDVQPVANALTVDGDQNVLFMDYEGYLKFDETILNKNNFTITANYKWAGNKVWWVGLLNVVGYDGDAGSNVSPQLQIKAPNGDVNGWGVVAGTAVPAETECHIAFTYNAGLSVLYVDGVEVGSSTDQVFHTLVDPVLLFGIKTSVDENGVITPFLDPSGKCKNTQKYVDNVALFDKTLSAEEVVGIYSGTSPIVTGVSVNEMGPTVIYPNPLQDVLNVCSNDVASIDIYNVAGVQVLSAQDVENGVDVSSLSKGVYVVKCINNQGAVVAVEKVVKE